MALLGENAHGYYGAQMAHGFYKPQRKYVRLTWKPKVHSLTYSHTTQTFNFRGITPT